MISSKEIKGKYLKFFEKRGHKVIPPAPLVLESDPTTLFTSSGMQQLVPYLKGEKHPEGKRLVDVQPSLRLQDLEEVGDNRHTTFFEMLGNWSLGDYFKKEQLAWIWEFYTKELGLPAEKLHVSVFEGNKSVPRDNESFEIWKKLGIGEKRIHFYPVEKNWWSRSGTPEEMPEGEIGGPDSEIFYEFSEVAHHPSFGKLCHPNCECGKFLEIGNSVFMQYLKEKDGGLKELPKKNVDFGGGLERIAAAINGKSDIFGIDVFKPIIKGIENETSQNYGVAEEKNRSFRIVADHVRAASALLAEGVIPANKLHGYAARRLIRRAIFHLHLLGSGISGGALAHIGESLKNSSPVVGSNWPAVEKELTEEGVRFGEALKKGLAQLTRLVSKNIRIDGKTAFDLYQSNGFPLELTIEILKQNGQELKEAERKVFEEEFEKHRDLSRTTSAGLFKGGLGSKESEMIIKLHTTTHLLQAALREILGEHVSQKGSNITAERLRFDFSYPNKLTDEEIEKTEDMINAKIKEDLPVSFEEKGLDEAIAGGALHFFVEKYGKKVKVYTIGNFSREVCGGPHVKRTGEIGRVRMIKQEKIGSGVTRIYLTL